MNSFQNKRIILNGLFNFDFFIFNHIMIIIDKLFVQQLKNSCNFRYGEYDTLCDVIDKYIHIKDKVLIIGCGNSKLSADLYDIGIYNSVSIDINASVIHQMKAKYGTNRPKMSFLEMDVSNVSYIKKIVTLF